MGRALTSLQKTMGYSAAQSQPREEAPVEDVEMAPEGALPSEVEAKIMETNQAYVLIGLMVIGCGVDDP